MDERQHERIARWERRWLAVSGALSLLFVLLLAYNLAAEGAHVARVTSRGTPQELLAQDIFAEPGVRELAPGHVQLSRVAQAFVWLPADARVPAGAQVDFYLTSRDVLHGYQVQDTNINVEVIPGEVSSFSYTFDEPGVYRVTCNEYCGIGHHTMLGTITVVPASEWAAGAAEEPTGEAEVAGVDGAAVYAANCAGCHQANGQGIPGAFPPVAGHSAELVANQGREYLMLVLLYGVQGPIEALGQNYDGVMPAWPQLGDDQLAAVANHIVELDATAAPDFEPYTPEEFAEARGQDLTPADVHARREE